MKTLTGTRLHVVHEKSYGMPPRTCRFTRIFLASNEVGNRRISANDREGCWNISYDGRGLTDQPLKLVRVFIEASKIFIFISLFDNKVPYSDVQAFKKKIFI
jgi:hypothetical protein